MTASAESNESPLSRRKMLFGMGSAAIASAALSSLTPSSARAQQSQGNSSESASSNDSKTPTNPGPTNTPEQQLNPSSFNPPPSDAGDVKPFKFSFEDAHNKVSKGGWARQVTVRDLPISTTIAGVNMRLEAGAIRELHWHVSGEWAFMLNGTARITAVDSDGKSFVDDTGPRDLWFFPGGIPHSIQGLGPDGCEFLLVFDDGSFSEFDTFLITDWMSHTPKEVLAKNFGMPESAFDPIPKKELYIFNAPLPGDLKTDQQAAMGPEGMVPETFSFRTMDVKPIADDKGGTVRIIDSRNFKASKSIAAAHVILKPGGLRELHWHPNADEWQYFISGNARQTIFVGGNKARTSDFHAGDVGYVQQSVPHYIENVGDTDVEFLEMFKSDRYQDISLGQWMSHLPPQLLESHLKMDLKRLASVQKNKLVVVPT